MAHCERAEEIGLLRRALGALEPCRRACERPPRTYINGATGWVVDGLCGGSASRARRAGGAALLGLELRVLALELRTRGRRHRQGGNMLATVGITCAPRSDRGGDGGHFGERRGSGLGQVACGGGL